MVYHKSSDRTVGGSRSGKKVVEQLFKVSQLNLSLSPPVNGFLPLHLESAVSLSLCIQIAAKAGSR